MTKRSKLLLTLTVAWGLFIFCNSLLPGEQSTGMSDAVVDHLPDLLERIDLQSLTRLVRKTAHFFEYALLGGLTAAVFWQSGWLKLRNAGNLLCPCLLWAVVDEFLQTFVEGRAGLVGDVLIDLGGILVGTLAVVLLARFLRRRKGQTQ